ncbi:unnamed protein product [Staurois parvus]|uniref:Uncharacterized protein n=1 Tax=Staurois parvus TaxID=386267 RepID=A0ABN9BWF8_9NEOB|nr:unnamed protein product [Staurois parvus]
MARTKQTACKSTGGKAPCKAPQERTGHRRSEEASPLQARHHGSPRDPTPPEIHRAAHPQAALLAPHPRDHPGLQDRPALPELRRHGSAGGRRGLSRQTPRGHQPLCHPRQEGHHHAQRHPAGMPHPRRPHNSHSTQPTDKIENINTNKVISNSAPNYITNLVSKYHPNRPLRSSHDLLLSSSLVSSSHAHLQDFSRASPILWNSLPQFIRLSPTLLTFRRSLKTSLQGSLSCPQLIMESSTLPTSPSPQLLPFVPLAPPS